MSKLTSIAIGIGVGFTFTLISYAFFVWLNLVEPAELWYSDDACIKLGVDDFIYFEDPCRDSV